MFNCLVNLKLCQYFCICTSEVIGMEDKPGLRSANIEARAAAGGLRLRLYKAFDMFVFGVISDLVSTVIDKPVAALNTTSVSDHSVYGTTTVTCWQFCQGYLRSQDFHGLFFVEN